MIKILYYNVSSNKKIIVKYLVMVEPLLSGIVLGLVPVTLSGLLVAAYLQYRRGNQFGL